MTVEFRVSLLLRINTQTQLESRLHNPISPPTSLSRTHVDPYVCLLNGVGLRHKWSTIDFFFLLFFILKRSEVISAGSTIRAVAKCNLVCCVIQRQNATTTGEKDSVFVHFSRSAQKKRSWLRQRLILKASERTPNPYGSIRGDEMALA